MKSENPTLTFFFFFFKKKWKPGFGSIFLPDIIARTNFFFFFQNLEIQLSWDENQVAEEISYVCSHFSFLLCEFGLYFAKWMILKIFTYEDLVDMATKEAGKVCYLRSNKLFFMLLLVKLWWFYCGERLVGRWRCGQSFKFNTRRKCLSFFFFFFNFNCFLYLSIF